MIFYLICLPICFFVEPLLYKAAQRVFSIPSNSAGNERVFSKIKFLLGKRRTMIAPSNVNYTITCSSMIKTIRKIKRRRLK